jgi:hypothetical protein
MSIEDTSGAKRLSSRVSGSSLLNREIHAKMRGRNDFNLRRNLA